MQRENNVFVAHDNHDDDMQIKMVMRLLISQKCIKYVTHLCFASQQSGTALTVCSSVTTQPVCHPRSSATVLPTVWMAQMRPTAVSLQTNINFVILQSMIEISIACKAYL